MLAGRRFSRRWRTILDALGRSHLRLGSFRHARDAFEESIALKQKLRNLWGLGASLTGLAECLLAAGQAQESLPYFQVNLLLLEALGGMQVLFVRNLARHLNALVASRLRSAGDHPRRSRSAGAGARTAASATRRSSPVPRTIRIVFCWAAAIAGWQRATPATEEERLAHVAEGVRQGGRARDLFARQGNWLRVAEANRTLAALLLDRAAGAIPPAPSPKREGARRGRPATLGQGVRGVETHGPSPAGRALEEAEQHHQGEVGRVQAELLWARYHQLAGTPYQMQLHLAAARRAAEASGYQALALGVDARLGVQLTGPTGPAATHDSPRAPRASEPDEVVVTALPGETVPLEIRASDWRDRPLPAYLLHGVVEPEEGPCPDRRAGSRPHRSPRPGGFEIARPGAVARRLPGRHARRRSCPGPPRGRPPDGPRMGRRICGGDRRAEHEPVAAATVRAELPPVAHRASVRQRAQWHARAAGRAVPRRRTGRRRCAASRASSRSGRAACWKTNAGGISAG